MGVFQDRLNPARNGLHLVFFHSTGGESGRSDVNATRHKWGTFFVRDGVLIDGNSSAIESLFGVFARDLVRSERSIRSR